MTSMKSRPGSALLVVLGMVAFMIVSAVSFSAYMRNSRLPSSYLRRTVYSRQLVKAALARAIDDVDRAIANNPHPGVGNTGNLNYWTGRVFSGGKNQLQDADRSDTVSVLTLEGLAYIPPPLVNYVRYYSRIADTAKWHSFHFDAGRYAFCAVDVSDYFDINRMTASEPRSSAANNRISLAYLFEDSNHKSSGGTNAKNWDEWMDNFRKIDEDTGEISYGSKVPLISLADFNLALGNHGDIGNMRSPFCNYINKKDDIMLGDDYGDTYGRMPFVTDSLFCNSSTNIASGASYDITDGENQPFSEEFIKKEKPSLVDFLYQSNMQSDDHMQWSDYLSELGCVALYDYLDYDHIPVSLAAPTVERTPMICGISLPFANNTKFTVTKKYDGNDERPGNDKLSVVPGSEGDKTRVVKCEVTYNISPDTWKFLRQGSVEALTAFPFTHEDEKDGEFKLDGQLSLFFTEGKTSLRSGNPDDDPYHLTKKKIEETNVDEQNGIIHMKLSPENFSMPKFPIKNEEDAIRSVSFELAGEAQKVQDILNDKPLLKVTYQWQQSNRKLIGSSWHLVDWYPSLDEVEQEVRGGANADANLSSEGGAHHCSLPASIWQNGTYSGVDSDMSDANIRNLITGAGKEVTLRTAVWLRVVDDEDNTVDMVPACYRDDKNQELTSNISQGLNDIENNCVGNSYPMMMVSAGVTFNFSLEGLEKLVENAPEMNFEQKRLVVADPRYNFAPEHWYSLQGNGELDANVWLDELQKLPAKQRPTDIFMMTSDAGYLQSPCEIAMLPRLTDLNPKNQDRVGLFEPLYDNAPESIVQSFAATRNSSLMWSTYEIYGDDRTAFNKVKWTNSGKGMKVNPYSDSTNVLMAVFANTPIDWKRASTNDVKDASECSFTYAGKMDEFNKKYAYNEFSDYKFKWQDLCNIAGRFSAKVRANDGNDDWKTAFDDLGWDDDTFGGDSSDMLWSVDRKFLYGYWRDCFAAEQQLFLIFVRAEPVMMGSGMMGKIPPQLGGRAVALVWRDPKAVQTSSSDGIFGYPHRTRVLFYHQLD